MSSEMKWKLVPVDPTEGMVEAGGVANPTDWNEGTDYTFPCDVAEAVYRAMLAAAPQPAPAGEPVCPLCGNKHDNDLLSDICRSCEEEAPWRTDAIRALAPQPAPPAGGE